MSFENNFVSYRVNAHASICLADNIYIDPYQIKDIKENAEIIFITHSHYDHLSIEDIAKIVKNDTIIVANTKSISILKESNICCKYFEVCKNQTNIKNIKNTGFLAFPAYNLDKPYHKIEDNGVGFYIEIYKENDNDAGKNKFNKNTFIVCGDSDLTPILSNLSYYAQNEDKVIIPRPDVLFVPIGGKYTMDSIEGAECTNLIQPKVVVPIHYNNVDGNKINEVIFKDKVNKNIKIEILI